MQGLHIRLQAKLSVSLLCLLLRLEDILTVFVNWIFLLDYDVSLVIRSITHKRKKTYSMSPALRIHYDGEQNLLVIATSLTLDMLVQSLLVQLFIPSLYSS